MKLSWGTGILLAILAFVGFIMYFFVITLVDKQYDHELVTENYYAQELDFQKDIDAQKQTLDAHMQVELSYTKGAKEGIRFDFPSEVAGKSVVGVISFYRPSVSKSAGTFREQLSKEVIGKVKSFLLSEGR